MDQSLPSALALLPLLLFLAIFLGSGIYYHLQGTEFAFYQIQAPVAALPALVLAFALSRRSLHDSVETFLRGAGHETIMAMCMIYLLAGAFSAVAGATGGVEATVALALRVIPESLLLPGLFLVGAFISTAMGTSMGTIAALAPIALGVAETAGLSLPLAAGTVLGGAMFGDNLSIISDTTIAATRSQGCRMRDKFAVNFFIALPAAVVVLLTLWLFSGGSEIPEMETLQPLKVLPYVVILIMALAGFNVFAVLPAGILLAGLIGMLTVDGYGITSLAGDIWTGFTKMQEIFILSLMIGGLGALMKEQGGLAFLVHKVEAVIRRCSRGGDNRAIAEGGIAGVVALTNLCTANNTVAIIVSGDVARDLARRNGVSPRHAASTLDIFACVIQGVIPYGAQILLVSSVMELSPLQVMGKVYYCFLLALAGVVAIMVRAARARA
ncbi:sodium:proton antiporter [Desulfuromonas versatilis]|uniref:Sodium:proton antiporter n=2 Tax=Desulfuromonas versatilis TaxID=2802975 RepID=A0ABM8HRG8_9BACT|nr:sodium:proton antiporter [Desulfuromonas versatilis]